MKIYKREQGRYVRGAIAFLIGIVVLFGCYKLYMWLVAHFSGLEKKLFIVPWAELPINGAHLISGGVLIACVIGLIIFYNHKKSAEFLIETEGEMKKVVWPSKQELIGSSVVVIIVVIIFAALLYLMDLVLRFSLYKIYKTF